MTTKTLPKSDRRHKAAIVRAARMGGSLAKHVRKALADVLAAIPDDVSPHHLIPILASVRLATVKLGPMLSHRLRAMLLDAARREHFATVVAITRAVNGSNRQLAGGTLRRGDADRAVGLRRVEGGGVVTSAL